MKRYCYIARKLCGCCVGVTTDSSSDETAHRVAEFIRDGLTVEHVDWDTYERIAQEPTFMDCPHGQLPLVMPEQERSEHDARD